MRLLLAIFLTLAAVFHHWQTLRRYFLFNFAAHLSGLDTSLYLVRVCAGPVQNRPENQKRNG